MKNVFLFMLMALPFGSTKSQAFDGVEIGGPISVAIEKFKAKGYKLVEKYETGARMVGKVGVYQVELYLTKTPKSGKFAKIGLYFDKRISWSSLLSDYNRMKEIIVDKYGIPTSDYETFVNPFYLGDGYEMTAVKIEKCIYASYWLMDTMNISLEISKFAQVNLSYENVANMDLLSRERAEKERSIF